MSKQTYLPPALALLPLPKPHVLYPYLQVSITLTTDVVSHLLATLSEQTETHKAETRDRYVAAVPVTEGDRRIGRWACGECWVYSALSDPPRQLLVSSAFSAARTTRATNGPAFLRAS